MVIIADIILQSVFGRSDENFFVVSPLETV